MDFSLALLQFELFGMAIGYTLFGIVLGIWLLVCIWDAWEYSGYGWAWTLAFFIFPPITIPYMIMSRLARRETSQDKLDEMARAKRSGEGQFKFATEIERAKFIAASDSGVGGTVYAGGIVPGSLGVSRDGQKHFTDARAEELLASGDHAAAREYLTDLHGLAVEDNDPERVSTYRFYLSRLPAEAAPARSSQGDKARDAAADRTLPF